MYLHIGHFDTMHLLRGISRRARPTAWRCVFVVGMLVIAPVAPLAHPVVPYAHLQLRVKRLQQSVRGNGGEAILHRLFETADFLSSLSASTSPQSRRNFLFRLLTDRGHCTHNLTVVVQMARF